MRRGKNVWMRRARHSRKWGDMDGILGALAVGAGVLVMLAVAVLVSLKDDYEAVNNEGKYNYGN